VTQTNEAVAGRPRISIIAAVARDRVIGRDNAMPWHLSEDLRHFRALTMGHPIIMGRMTHQSLGRALPGRRNIVVSRSAGFATAGCEVARSLEAAFAACAGASEVFVIGGAQIYAAALPLADRLHLTEIDAQFEGDTRFPAIDWSDWREIARQHRHSDDGFAYDFATYERVRRRPA